MGGWDASCDTGGVEVAEGKAVPGVMVGVGQEPKHAGLGT